MDDDYHDDADDGMAFWEIAIFPAQYPLAHGVMYDKPTPATVKARIRFPRLEPRPAHLWPKDRVRLSARCANKCWMRDIMAEVVAVRHESNGDQTIELLLYRKGREPGA